MHWRSICCPVCTPSAPTSKKTSQVVKMAVVKTQYGVLQGCVCEGTEGSYVAFKGIPYAKPPIGALRFKAPEPPEPWEDIRDATSHGPVCPQYNERLERIDLGSEDCLYLNVYTKTLTPPHPLPVMVWIHGGGFYTGSGNSDFYGPDFFMAHDVILVTFNYRLEVLGFLCLETEEVPGNAGLKDQVAALKWVKQNIAAFGGDPNNVTIFGCSAGAASASLHLVSKMSQGLFNKAICQSGVCLNEWGYTLYGRKRAFQLGKRLGLETEDPQELLEFLRTVPASSLISIQLPFIESGLSDIADGILFGPVIEKSELNVEKFITDLPPDLVKYGKLANVPVIVGYTSGEGIEIARKLPTLMPFLPVPGAVVPRELKLKWETDKIHASDKKIRKIYFDGNEVTPEMLQEVTNLETDRMFSYNIRRYARYHCLYNTEPVYLYKFTPETERNYTKKLYKMESVKGVCHSEDLHYLFHVTCLDIPLTDESRGVIRQVVKLWTNFAKTGKPTTDNFTEWKPFFETERNCCIIGAKLSCTQDVDGEHMKFWDDIYGETKIKRL
ncbi:juvenile hormone esterase-like [Cydia pomonella]|uniref:juvenile hormone esterase-like n=1 Tax=Cydia pomonella TaxID=82600 RepID=UPI002ADD8D13|nr:juvenile hormone esterase-like [Cydia pomonella]